MAVRCVCSIQGNGVQLRGVFETKCSIVDTKRTRRRPSYLKKNWKKFVLDWRHLKKIIGWACSCSLVCVSVCDISNTSGDLWLAALRGAVMQDGSFVNWYRHCVSDAEIDSALVHLFCLLAAKLGCSLAYRWSDRTVVFHFNKRSDVTWGGVCSKWGYSYGGLISVTERHTDEGHTAGRNPHFAYEHKRLYP